jgi:hypothetical protein
MAERIPLRLTRPYASVEEFVVAEGWTIGKNGVVLIGQPPLEAGTEVRCEIALSSGEPLVRAEGTVVREIPAQAGRPSGLQIKFQRVTPATKAFIKRAQDLRGAQPGERADVGSDVRAAPEPRPPSAPSHRSATSWARPSRAPGAPISRALDALRIRAGQSIPPPDNRDELLRRLRERAGSGNRR